MPLSCRSLTILAPPLLAALAIAGFACGGNGGDTLTIYSGRSEELVGPLLEQFADETGIDVRVKYGDTGEMAATILEEGGNSPADVFFAQDAGALGALDAEGRLVALPQELLDRVDEAFRSPDGRWVGASGRARVVAYNTDAVSADELPDSILEFTDPEWKGRIGWAPTNGSFQSFVTALRLIEGEDAARAWLEGIKANDPTDYPSNDVALQAVIDGEVDVAFVNHYYLFRMKAEQGEDIPAANHYTSAGDAGSLINVAGVAVLDTAGDGDLAERFVDFLLSNEAQAYFADETYEYPLIDGVQVQASLVPLAELEPPSIDLGGLSDLEGTLDLLRDTGVLP
jgi:iron(III) transport system substrate-binding protein